MLDQSRSELQAAVATIEPGSRARRPEPHRWSVNEILEHLALVERRFEATIRQAIAKAQSAGLGVEQEPRMPLAEGLRTVVRDRAGRRKAPDAVVPTGTLDDAAAWKAVEQARQSFRRTIDSADGLALGSVTAEHHRWGPLTVYQWVEVLANHEARHAEQVAEVGASLGAAGV
jgi:DinB superfamily